MVLTKILLLSVVAVFSYICFAFLCSSPTKTLGEIFEDLVTDSTLVIIIIASSGVVFISLLWRAAANWITENRYYAERISLEEYDKQKEFYTQSKIYELKNTKEYKDYIENRYSCKNKKNK